MPTSGSGKVSLKNLSSSVERYVQYNTEYPPGAMKLMSTAALSLVVSTVLLNPRGCPFIMYCTCTVTSGLTIGGKLRKCYGKTGSKRFSFSPAENGLGTMTPRNCIKVPGYLGNCQKMQMRPEFTAALSA